MFPAARLTDQHTCPIHGAGPVTGPGCPTVQIGGLFAARVGDSCACANAADVIVVGSPTVFIGGMPAARVTDATAHGGAITLGLPTVLIGGAAAPPTGALAAALSASLAGALTQPGGSADANDAALVAADLARLPPKVLQALSKAGTKVVASRGSITDHATDLRGVHPRGWPPGSTWDSVPGVFRGDKNELIVATVGHGTPAGAHVPAKGEGHGSESVVLHEAMHGYDHTASPDRSTAADFNTARTADSASLSTYENQPGAAGQEESYAESAARYYSGNPNDATAHPNLNAYWKSQ